MGLGGSMHLTDLNNYNLGASGIVAGAIPIAVGVAFTLKRNNSENIVVSLFGDGASNQGMALESFNLASMWQVPVLFYCENNMYAMSSPYEKFVAGNNIPARATSFGIEAVSIDGNDISKVYDTVTEVSEYIRKTNKPYLIESRTYRQLGHSKSDQRKYRTKEEEDYWISKCPIEMNKQYLTKENNISLEMLDSIEKNVIDEIEDCVEYCMSKKDDILSIDDALKYVYADKEYDNEHNDG